MTNEERLCAIDECGKFDESLSDGRMVKSVNELPISIDIKKLLNFCKATGKDSSTLTNQEIAKYVIQ